MSSGRSASIITKDFWLVKAGRGDNYGFLVDYDKELGKGILVFRSKKAAEDEARTMNGLNCRSKHDPIYSAVKGKKEDIEDQPTLLQ
jgi:hypothetical protein